MWSHDIHGNLINLNLMKMICVGEVEDDQYQHGLIAVEDSNHVDGQYILYLGSREDCEEAQKSLSDHLETHHRLFVP